MDTPKTFDQQIIENLEKQVANLEKQIVMYQELVKNYKDFTEQFNKPTFYHTTS